jgi:hypothetical protein
VLVGSRLVRIVLLQIHQRIEVASHGVQLCYHAQKHDEER